MNPWAALRRVMVPLLAANVLAQGIASLVPHQHSPETVLGRHESPEHRGVPGSREVAPVGDRLPASTCLACVVTPLAFADAEAAPSPARVEACSPADSRSVNSTSLPRLWRRPLRGPPDRA